MTKAKMKKCSFCEKVLPEDKLKREVTRSYRVYYFCDECAKKRETDIERANVIALKYRMIGGLRLDNVWIPISLQEPFVADHVLVTLKWGEDDYEVCECDYGVTKYCAECTDENLVRKEDAKKSRDFLDHIIAWRFMPEPYEETDNGGT